jgi:hypothetical protein
MERQWASGVLDKGVAMILVFVANSVKDPYKRSLSLCHPLYPWVRLYIKKSPPEPPEGY